MEKYITHPNPKMHELCAREVKYFPDKLRHQIFDELSTEDNPKIKKYLARNINYYYRNIGNRINIFDNLSKDADLYANIALANSLKWLGDSTKESRFEQLFNKNDMIVTSALARNIDIFNEDEKVMSKWTKKLLEVDDVRVKRSLCEVAAEFPKDVQKEAVESLLQVEDMNAKEFLADSLFSLPHYEKHTDWLEKLLENCDNTVRRVLAANIHKMKNPEQKKIWTEKILKDADSSVSEIMQKNQ